MENITFKKLLKPVFMLSFLLNIFAHQVAFANPVNVVGKMSNLDVLAGKWQLVVKFTQDDGQTWQSAPAVEVDIEMAHKGRLLREIPATPLEKGFNMETYLTYDQYRGVYRKAAIDDVWGIMDVYEGVIENNQLVMTNLKAGTTFPIREGVWRAFRLTIELKDKEREMTIEASDDHGQTWKPAFVAHYTKI